LERIRDVFNAATGEMPPPEWAESDNLPEILARWDINYAHYLVDRGDYRQAAELLQVAYDLASNGEIRADALLELGSLHGRFLLNPSAALEAYTKVLEEYPRLSQAERALFYSAQILFDRNDFAKAREALEKYLARYPAGAYRDNAGILLKMIEQEMLRKGRGEGPSGSPRN
jgi:TolA-binding protein